MTDPITKSQLKAYFESTPESAQNFEAAFKKIDTSGDDTITETEAKEYQVAYQKTDKHSKVEDVFYKKLKEDFNFTKTGTSIDVKYFRFPKYNDQYNGTPNNFGYNEGSGFDVSINAFVAKEWADSNRAFMFRLTGGGGAFISGMYPQELVTESETETTYWNGGNFTYGGADLFGSALTGLSPTRASNVDFPLYIGLLTKGEGRLGLSSNKLNENVNTGGLFIGELLFTTSMGLYFPIELSPSRGLNIFIGTDLFRASLNNIGSYIAPPDANISGYLQFDL
ncbi:MAG: hypothetical protein ACD_73C00226G0002 [uncultured bacterium]|nr:MAG: hypothetical protein ACD_73C00226G0002 [uncultured bacterium]